MRRIPLPGLARAGRAAVLVRELATGLRAVRATREQWQHRAELSPPPVQPARR